MSNNVHSLLGTSMLKDHKREKDDYYATSPIAVHKLLELESFNNN